jgi:glycerol-3-phosphate O-acyltransferase
MSIEPEPSADASPRSAEPSREPAHGALADRVDRALAAGVHPSAMVPNMGGLFTRLLTLLVSGVVFSSRAVSALKEVQSQGPTVLVMPTRSWIDYLYFNIAIAQHGLKLSTFANGVNTWTVRPFWRAIRTLIRGRRGLPRDVDCFERVLRANGTTVVFLQRRGRGTHDRRTFSRPYLDRALELQRSLGTTIQVVPLLLVWDKHPDRDQPTLIDEMFGSPQEPGFFRKLTLVAQQTWESFLNLGAPQVQVSDAMDLGEWVASGQDAAALERDIADTLEAERRVIVGPGVKSARQLRQEILTDPRTVAAIREVSDETSRDIATLQREAGDALKSIAADFNLFVIKGFSALLSAIFSQIYDGLDVDEEGIDRLRRLARDRRVVLVPSHKSHIDYLVLSYVFYQRGLIPPHIAAGDNLSFWPIGPLFRRAGAFFLRRSFSDDPLYGRIFNAYIVKLLEEGFFVEFFIEGTRSRTGKLNPPKYGMLTMLLNAHRVGGVEDLVFVPVSVGYENIIEGSDYRKELQGAEKKSESFTGLIKTSQVLRSRYGRVHVEVGDAIDAASYLAEHHPDGTEALPKEDLDRTVRRLAYRVIHSINSVTTVTPSALAALILLNNPARGMDRDTLAREAGFVLAFLQEQSARMSGSIQNALNARFVAIHGIKARAVNVEVLDEYDREFVAAEESPELPSEASMVRRTDRALGDAILSILEEALGLLADKELVEVREADGQTLFVAPDARRTELAYYKNNIIHYFVDEAVFASALYGSDGVDAPVHEVRERARLLSRLMKHEFCFAERGQFEQVFERTLKYFEDRGWVRRTPDDVLEATSPPPAGAEFFRGLLIPTLESYFLIARVLPEIAEDWTEDKSLTRRLLARGDAMHLTGEIEHGEAIAKATVENALRIFREWNVLERRERDRGRARKRQWEYRLSDDYRGARLDELHALLESLVERQKRKPGELLREL